MKRESIGTILVGSNVLLREGLARILSAAGFRIIASASDVDDSIQSSLPQQQSILLIIDIDSGDDFDARLAQIKYFKQRCPAGRVVVLAHQHQPTETVSALRAGANAYLVKVATCDTFIKSLELVILGETLLPAAVLRFMCNQQHGRAAGPNSYVAHHSTDDGPADDIGEMIGTKLETNELLPHAKTSFTPRLSARQQSILRGLVQGDSNKTIARKMAITEATVKVHIKAILRKIRVHNRTQAAIWAMSTDPFISANGDASGGQLTETAAAAPETIAALAASWPAESQPDQAPDAAAASAEAAQESFAAAAIAEDRTRAAAASTSGPVRRRRSRATLRRSPRLQPTLSEKSRTP